MDLGWEYPRRKSLIKELTQSKTTKSFGVPYQNRFDYYSQYSIPIGAPKYRLNNGRTFAAQEEYLAQHPDLPIDFFIVDPELDAALAVQHNLLKEMIGDKGLYDHFKDNDQREPLILTSDGFVVNGNRRLCAMRELLEQDPDKYTRFAHIEVVVLPPGEEKDLDELEAELQLSPDIKADYSWYARALMMRRRKHDYGYTKERLEKLFGLSEKQINELLDMLAYGEEFLENRGTPRQYHLLEGKEYGFRSMRKVRTGRKLKSEEEKQVFTTLSYCLLDDPEGGRVYESIPDIAEYFDKVSERLSEELLAGSENQRDGEDAAASALGIVDHADTRTERLLDALEDKQKQNSAREVVIDVVRGEKLRQRELKRKNFVISQLRKANSALLDAMTGLTKETPREGLTAQLDAIEKSIRALRKALDGNS